MNRVCVFCGSSPGASATYGGAARTLGRLLAERDLTLVYGGGSVGLMGVLADAALASGGRVIGVIPDALATREVAHQRLTEMRVVPSMHARKALMAELSDAFVGLPGGFGTFEELLEIITWGQLGIHSKPVGVLNIAGYYEGLIRLVDHAISEGFIAPGNRDLFLVADQPEALLDRLSSHRPPRTRRWVTPQQS